MVVGFPIKGEQKKIYVFLWHILPTFAMGVFELFLGGECLDLLNPSRMESSSI